MSKSAMSKSSSPTPAAATIALVQANSLPMLVQRELERMILAGDLAAGAKLNEAAVADLLGVSRGHVREAFRELEDSGAANGDRKATKATKTAKAGDDAPTAEAPARRSVRSKRASELETEGDR